METISLRQTIEDKRVDVVAINIKDSLFAFHVSYFDGQSYHYSNSLLDYNNEFHRKNIELLKSDRQTLCMECLADNLIYIFAKIQNMNSVVWFVKFSESDFSDDKWKTFD